LGQTVCMSLVRNPGFSRTPWPSHGIALRLFFPVRDEGRTPSPPPPPPHSCPVSGSRPRSFQIAFSHLFLSVYFFCIFSGVTHFSPLAGFLVLFLHPLLGFSGFSCFVLPKFWTLNCPPTVPSLHLLSFFLVQSYLSLSIVSRNFHIFALGC